MHIHAPLRQFRQEIGKETQAYMLQAWRKLKICPAWYDGQAPKIVPLATQIAKE